MPRICNVHYLRANGAYIYDYDTYIYHYATYYVNIMPNIYFAICAKLIMGAFEI